MVNKHIHIPISNYQQILPSKLAKKLARGTKYDAVPIYASEETSHGLFSRKNVASFPQNFLEGSKVSHPVYVEGGAMAYQGYGTIQSSAAKNVHNS